MTALQLEKQLYNDSFWNLYGHWDQRHKACKRWKKKRKEVQWIINQHGDSGSPWSSSRKSLWSESHSVVSDSLQPHGLYSPWNSPGQNTGLGSLSLFQGIFPTQGLNPGLLHCRQILYQLSHKGSPKMLEWVAYPFSSGSSWPRNRTRVSCIAGWFFTNWAMREKLGDP